MTTKYDQIFINGDSYTAKDEEHLVYSEFIQQELNIPVTNRAVPGSNNNRIFRDSVESLLKIKNNSPNDKVLAIIGLSFVARDEIWYEGKDKHILSVVPDLDNFPDSKLITADWLFKPSDWDHSVRSVIVDLNINRMLTHFYTTLFMFVNTLEINNIDYIIFSAANNTDWKNANWTFLKSLAIFNKCQANPNILDIHNFSVPTFARNNNLPTTDSGHLLENGHKEFSKFLLDKIGKLM